MFCFPKSFKKYRNYCCVFYEIDYFFFLTIHNERIDNISTDSGSYVAKIEINATFTKIFTYSSKSRLMDELLSLSKLCLFSDK